MSNKTINQNYTVQLRNAETQAQALARTVTNPESLSASVLTICQNIDQTQVNEMVDELKQQSAAIHNNDMSRAESMLIAQAHTLDGLFAKLASHALTSNDLGKFERYMKLALRAQAQSRATLQTLGEVKTPKQFAYVGQANIGNQVQVNNECVAATRTREKQKAQNELMEVQHDERLDARTTGKASRTRPAMAAVEK